MPDSAERRDASPPAETAPGAQAPFDATVAQRLVGALLAGRYRIEALVGVGGMGAVYRAEHVPSRRRVAVKVLHAHLAATEEAAARFEREAIAGARIEHPNVAAASDFGVMPDGARFLALEYLEGEDLRAVIARGPLPAASALRIARQLALALGAAHRLGIVHRDLKPENVMLVRRDQDPARVKLLDFGMAKVPAEALPGARSSAALTRLGVACGTPEYMAPEQAFGEEVDGRADLHALGVVLYEMLCGERPFTGADRGALLQAVTAQPAPPLAARAPRGSLPAGLEELVGRLLAKNAAGRPASAAEVVEAIDRIGEGCAEGEPLAALDGGTDASLMVARQARAAETAAFALQPSAKAAPARAGQGPSALEPTGGEPPRWSTANREEGVALDRLSDAMPVALRGLPLAATFSFTGLALATAVVGLAVLLRGPATVAALEQAPEMEQPAASAAAVEAPPASPTGAAAPEAPSAPAVAPEADLEASRAGGLAALGPLAQRFPGDPAVLQALLAGHAGEGNYLMAMQVARRLFVAAPALAADEAVRDVIRTAAQGRSPDAAAAAFDLLSTRMGSGGPDVLFELAAAPAMPKPTRERAVALLATPEVRQLATRPLLVAEDLRASLPCARKALFARAQSDGDARAVPYLRPLTATSGCGFLRRSDCYGCLTRADRAALREALEAIERRPTPP